MPVLLGSITVSRVVPACSRPMFVPVPERVARRVMRPRTRPVRRVKARLRPFEPEARGGDGPQRSPWCAKGPNSSDDILTRIIREAARKSLILGRHRQQYCPSLSNLREPHGLSPKSMPRYVHADRYFLLMSGNQRPEGGSTILGKQGFSTGSYCAKIKCVPASSPLSPALRDLNFLQKLHV